MYKAKMSALCSAPDIVAVLTNDGSSSEQLGLTSCIVRKATIYRGVEKLKTKGAATDGKVRYFLQNVECSAYPHGSRGIDQARRVHAALVRLADAARHR